MDKDIDFQRIDLVSFLIEYLQIKIVFMIIYDITT